MKKIYLLGLASLFAMGVNAQTTLKVKNLPKKGKTERAMSPNSVQQMTGNLTCQTQYVPNSTMDLQFTLELTNTDAEYGDKLDITFPAGFTINSTTNNPLLGPDDGDGASDGPEAYNGITGQTISWGNDDNSYGGIVPSYDPDGPGTYVITINVTIGAISGAQNVTFDVSGDGYGSGPGDLVGGTCTVYETGTALVDLAMDFVQPFHLTATNVCNYGVDTLIAQVRNVGTTTEHNITVNFTVDGVAQTPFMIDSLEAGDSTYAVAIPGFDFNATQDFVIKAFVTQASDISAVNDTAAFEFTNSQSVDLSTTPYVNGLNGTGLDFHALFIAINSGTTNWNVNATTPHSGAASAFLQASGAAADAWMMFRCMDVTAGDTYRLSYWTRTNTGFNGGISVSIGASQTAADMNSGLEIKPFVANTANSQWKKDSVDYLAPMSGTIYLGFHGVGTATGSGTHMRLDDINIMKVTAPVGIKDNASTEAVTVFPNPSNGIFTIRATENNSSVEVYSIIGENVYTSNLVKGYNTVELSNLAAGTYIVKVKSGNQVISKRVVINK